MIVIVRTIIYFRFKGSHTGQKINDKFEEVCEKYGIIAKLDFIITDNASNMRRAFSVCFPTDEANLVVGQEENAATNSMNLDYPELWEDVLPDELNSFYDTVDNNRKKTRLQCFSHTLQLAIKDGMKESKAVSPALSKCSKLCSTLHTSCSFKEQFESVFGSKVSIPSDNCTRWNSTYRQVKAVVSLTLPKLNSLVRSHAPNLCFSPKEWSQLTELLTLLHPFTQAADLSQGDKLVTSSCVLPSVIPLHQHCKVQVESLRYLIKTAAALRDALFSRFKGQVSSLFIVTIYNKKGAYE